MAKPSQTHCLLQNGPLRPHFYHRMAALQGGQPLSFYGGNGDGDTLGTFFVWFWTLLVLQSHGVLLPGAAFFEAVLPASAAAAAATSSASSRRQQKLFFQDFRRHVRHFFRVVLDLARPSEPQCFACSCQHYQQQQDHGKRMLKQQQGSRRQAAVSKRVGSRQEIHSLPAGSSEQALLGCHCNALFRPLVPWCFPVRQVIFSKLFYGSSRRQQKLSKKVVFLGFQKYRQALFWRGFGTCSSFRGTVFSPRQVIFSKLFCGSSRRQQKLSKKVVFPGFQK